MPIPRVGNNQLSRKLMLNLRGQLAHQEKLFEQISSNKKVLRPSDDPLATTHIMDIQDHLNRNGEYESAISKANVWTNVSTTALDNAISTWKRVNEVTISAADGTKTAADRIGIAEEVEQLLQHLVQIGNTTHAGQYIFSGSKTNEAAFSTEVDANTGRLKGVYFEGDSQVRHVKSKDASSVPLNVLGGNAGDPNQKGIFIDSKEGLNTFDTLIRLRDKLLNNDTVGISGEGGILEEVDKISRSLTSAQVRVGGSQEILNLDRNRIIDENATLESFREDVEKADVAKLILELNNFQNVYEAALASGGRLFQRSLLNYI